MNSSNLTWMVHVGPLAMVSFTYGGQSPTREVQLQKKSCLKTNDLGIEDYILHPEDW